MVNVRAILDYSLAANVYTSREWAHNSYLYARSLGVQRLDLWPNSPIDTEVCSIADTVNWPGKGERIWYRLFQREVMRTPQAPVKLAPNYVHPDKLVKWTVD